MDRIDFIVASTKGPAVLNLGCTGGTQDMDVARGSPSWLHARLSEQPFEELWGLDISQRKITDMETMGYTKLVVADAQDFELQTRFDTIVAGELIEHLPNPGALLDAVARNLKPGGRLILSTPYAAGLPNVLYAWLKYPKTCSNPEHTAWFCPSTLARLAEARGFRVTEWHLTYDFPAGVEGRYGWFVRLYRLLARFLPERMRCNDLVAVLEPLR